MSHKRKINPIPEANMQAKKTKHYTNIENLKKALLHERAKENGLFEQKIGKERVLAGIRYCLNHANTHPEQPMIQHTICGWMVFHPNGTEASKQLTNEQNNTEKEISILMTQIQMSIERQSEIENALRKYPVWDERLQNQRLLDELG